VNFNLKNLGIVSALVMWATLTLWAVIALVGLRERVSVLEAQHYTFVENVTNALQSYYLTLRANTMRQRTLEEVVYVSKDIYDIVEQLHAYNEKTSVVSLEETSRLKAEWKNSIGGDE